MGTYLYHRWWVNFPWGGSIFYNGKVTRGSVFYGGQYSIWHRDQKGMDSIGDNLNGIFLHENIWILTEFVVKLLVITGLDNELMDNKERDTSCQLRYTYFHQWMGHHLTHWGWDNMAAIFQRTFSNVFSWMKMYEFRLRFHWYLFLTFKLTISQH